jgi:uncharacterized protein YycO
MKIRRMSALLLASSAVTMSVALSLPTQAFADPPPNNADVPSMATTAPSIPESESPAATEAPGGTTEQSPGVTPPAESEPSEQVPQVPRSSTTPAPQKRVAPMAVAAGCQTYPPTSFQVCGRIRDKYNQTGGPAGFLLFPKSNELTNPGNTGKRSEFVGGNIYWSAATDAHPVAHEFLTKWGEKGYESGYMKYPTTDEIVLSDGTSRRQEYQGGSIYFKFGIGARTIQGAIRDKWRAMGAETGALKFPTTDETVTPDGKGRFNRFEGGVVYWSAATGAQPVMGGILDKWASAGYEKSTYGYPKAAATTPDGGATYTQQFERGTITAPGPEARELAARNPGTTAEEMIDAARQWAQDQSAPLIDVLVEAVRKARQYAADTPTDDDWEYLPFARGKGDIFYADSSLAVMGLVMIINHGHNGIYASTTNTVEAAKFEEGEGHSGVNEVDNRTAGENGGRREVRSPQVGYVNTDGATRDRAVTFALSKIGKSYNNNFAFNRFINDEQYNCSQLVWASYMHASNDEIDLRDWFPNPTPSVYPKELFASDHVTKYYPA